MSQGSKGGQVTAIRARAKAIASYENNPNYCIHCKSKIEINNGQKVAEVRLKIFCNKSCAAKHNNWKTPKRRALREKLGQCSVCKSSINLKRAPSGGFIARKLCDACLAIYKTHKMRVVRDSLESKISFESVTKCELFKNRKNWQSANSCIRKHARRIYALGNGAKECKVCGYNNHIQVCHIDQVCDFSDETTIAEINALSNLVALCPNHHWELDHGLLILGECSSFAL